MLFRTGQNTIKNAVGNEEKYQKILKEEAAEYNRLFANPYDKAAGHRPPVLQASLRELAAELIASKA